MRVLIKDGIWRKSEVTNKEFDVHQAYDASKGYIIVHGSKEMGLEDAKCRIKVNPDGFVYVGEPEVSTASVTPFKAGESTVVNYERSFRESESEEEAMERIANTFDVYERIVKSVIDGKVHGLIVSGPPGIGKSHTVVSALEEEFGTESMRYEIVGGYASAFGIYKALYRNSGRNNILVFDDCDAALDNEDAINPLKRALDGGLSRTVSWMSDNKTLKAEDIPDRFEFNGRVIFLTNTDFERCTSPKLKPHVDAMLSRCHYLDLEMGSQRDQLLRIKHIVENGLLEEFDLDEDEHKEIMEFVYENFNHLKESSLRIVKKIAGLYVADRYGWKELAEVTCLRKAARYERMYKEKFT